MSETTATAAKAPERPAAQIIADIESERRALDGSFEALRRDLDEVLDAGQQRARDAGRRAAVIGPAAAGLVASVVIARRLIRRRSAKGA